MDLRKLRQGQTPKGLRDCLAILISQFPVGIGLAITPPGPADQHIAAVHP
jgi:hypothetical protein